MRCAHSGLTVLYPFLALVEAPVAPCSPVCVLLLLCLVRKCAFVRNCAFSLSLRREHFPAPESERTICMPDTVPHAVEELLAGRSAGTVLIDASADHVSGYASISAGAIHSSACSVRVEWPRSSRLFDVTWVHAPATCPEDFAIGDVTPFSPLLCSLEDVVKTSVVRGDFRNTAAGDLCIECNRYGRTSACMPTCLECAQDVRAFVGRGAHVRIS